ncbi:HlyD family type I secretion periplasmic adaptor subunit [Shinella sp. S4-D37]|uniref:HlyD family type I secretion periplasmic adaptor subunit n=1 Tax=Shinella sp. S4-D37 TaxID=3161999 RepID=UPI003465671D
MQTEQETVTEFVKRPSPPPLDELRLDGLQTWSNPIPTGQRRQMMLAGAVLFFVVGIGGFWSATAKIGSALVTPGRVVAEGNNRIVQHLEGGIVESISVKEGALVEAGALLLSLDESASKSQLERVFIERAINTIELERWRAERAEADTFHVNPKALAPVDTNPRVQEAQESRLAEFQSAKKERQQQLSMLDNRIANEEEDLVYLKAQIAAYDSQSESITKEESDLSDLLEKGLTSRARVLALRRELSRIEAQKSNALATIQKSYHNIKSLNDQKKRVILENSVKTSQKITETQQKLNENDDVINRLKDRIKRSAISAPATGIVLSMHFKSIGEVIKPGETIAEIIPAESKLQMEVPVPPKSISKLFLNQSVNITFPSDQANVVPPLKGEVSYISADTILGEEKIKHYIVKVDINENWHGRKILPGNVGEVFFQTDSKTLIEYLADPITRFLSKTHEE